MGGTSLAPPLLYLPRLFLTHTLYAVEAEILNHRLLRHPHVIEFKEVRGQ